MESKQVFVPQQTELTIPESPAINKPKQRVYNEPEPIRIKANPVPDLKKQFKPSIQSRKLAVPHSQLPGDYIHEKKRAEIAKKLEQEAKELEQSRKFKAQPILNVKQVPQF